MWRLMKALVVTPRVVFAILLIFPVASLLPPLPGLVTFVGGVVTVTLLLAGLGEPAVMRVLYLARRPTQAEGAALAPAATVLARHGLDTSRIDLWVLDSDEHGVAAQGVGRRSVLVTAAVIAEVRAGRLPADQAAAVIGHAAGTVLTGLTRNDPAIAFWTMPWTLVRGVVRGIAERFAWLPAVTVAWRARFVVGAITVVQGIQEGAPASIAAGITGGVVIGLTYLVPYLERAWDRTVRGVGDAQLRRHGLGPAYGRLLLRGSTTPAIHERIHRLTATGSPVAPVGDPLQPTPGPW